MDAKDQLQAYVRDYNKAREIAARHPGTEVTVNGVYAYVPDRKPSFFASLFGALFDPPPR